MSEWTIDAVLLRVGELLKDAGLPSPAKPAGLADPYPFPTDPKTLEMTQLGQLRLQLAAYLGYTKLLLGGEDLELTALKKVFEVKADLVANVIVSGWEKANGRAPGREFARSLAIDGDPQLKRVYQQLIEREARAMKLKVQAEIYQVGLDALSREQSRRESEVRA